MGARAFSHSGLGAGLRGAMSIWMSSGALAMRRIYCTMPRSECESHPRLQRVQVRYQVGDVVHREFVLESRHLGAPHLDDVDHPLVIRRNAARHVLLLEQPVHAGAAQIALTVGVMTFGATHVVHS